jgi:hypothetical protein
VRSHFLCVARSRFSGVGLERHMKRSYPVWNRSCFQQLRLTTESERVSVTGREQCVSAGSSVMVILAFKVQFLEIP